MVLSLPTYKALYRFMLNAFALASHCLCMKVSICKSICPSCINYQSIIRNFIFGPFVPLRIYFCTTCTYCQGKYRAYLHWKTWHTEWLHYWYNVFSVLKLNERIFTGFDYTLLKHSTYLHIVLVVQTTYIIDISYY